MWQTQLPGERAAEDSPRGGIHVYCCLKRVSARGYSVGFLEIRSVPCQITFPRAISLQHNGSMLIKRTFWQPTQFVANSCRAFCKNVAHLTELQTVPQCSKEPPAFLLKVWPSGNALRFPSNSSNLPCNWVLDKVNFAEVDLLEMFKLLTRKERQPSTFVTNDTFWSFSLFSVLNARNLSETFYSTGNRSTFSGAWVSLWLCTH